MVFETRKIQSETLGEYLREIRLSKRHSLEEAAGRASMKPVLLEALESGEFHKLPPDVYVVGFIRGLADFYGLDASVLTQQYKKECGIDRQLSRQKDPLKPRGIGRWASRVVVTPKFLSFTLGSLFVLVTVLYVIWQVASINRSPALEIYKPTNRQIITGTSVEVEGQTDPATDLSINGESVFVDSTGRFATQIGMGGGAKDLIFLAKNKFGKSVSETVTVIGQAGNTGLEPKFSLEFSFSQTVELSFAVDGGGVETRTFEAEGHLELTAQRDILVSTSNGGATTVTLNGKKLGVMGRSGEVLQRVRFTAESGSGDLPTE